MHYADYVDLFTVMSAFYTQKMFFCGDNREQTVFFSFFSGQTVTDN